MPNNPLIEAFKQTLINMGQNERNLGQGVPPPPMYQRPEVNLDPIRIIQSLTGGGQPQQQAPQQPQMPVPPMNIASPMENVALAGQQTPQGNGINWQMLMDIGIPALSAIIGTAAPGTLAGASGFSSGYTGAREKQREAETKQKNLKELMGIKSGIKKTPSKESLLKMAQNEAFRQMGGSAFGGMALQNLEKKAKYESLVKSLYDSYVSQFIGQDNTETTVEDIDTSDDVIDQEWEKYQSGNL